MTKCKKCGGTLNGKTCNLCELFKVGQAFAGVEQARGNNPNASLALKVQPGQVQEAIADARKKGVAVEFRKDGTPLFTSRRQKAAYLRAYGVINKDGGYSD